MTITNVGNRSKDVTLDDKIIYKKFVEKVVEFVKEIREEHGGFDLDSAIAITAGTSKIIDACALMLGDGPLDPNSELYQLTESYDTGLGFSN